MLILGCISNFYKLLVPKTGFYFIERNKNLIVFFIRNK